ncbi:hypothetical protein BRC68_06310 [Halobacteriales archaeon QH_6_64_20]|nr:MAG: hypothetical protein BRC68_06310 [Halobacteriales archaeon QH_6_64_20]
MVYLRGHWNPVRDELTPHREFGSHTAVRASRCGAGDGKGSSIGSTGATEPDRIESGRIESVTALPP